MTTNRREFIERLGATAMLGALPMTAIPSLVHAPEVSLSAGDWDFKWTTMLKTKKHKACFDCAEIDSGYGVWRASMWEGQYHEALGAKPSETATVLVLRHAALVLVFKQDFWDANGI